MTIPITTSNGALSAETVPLRTGPPTREELLVYYPAKFTWTQLRTFVNSGDLGLLKRDRKLHKRYEEWAKGIKVEYGSMINYLMNHRLQWGRPDTLSLLPSTLRNNEAAISPPCSNVPGALPPIPTDSPKYFSCDTPPEYISIIQNDWPYSVPAEIEHTLIWTRVPVFHEDLVDRSVSARIEQDGLWGFTGSLTPPPSPSTLPLCLPALSEWGVTKDKMIKSEKGTLEEEALVRRAGEEVQKFVQNRWIEAEWETAWFVNPPRLQSVPGLAHIHVFARRKF